MRPGNIIIEQPGKGVLWPIDNTGRLAPIVFPDGRAFYLALWVLNSDGTVLGLLDPSGQVITLSGTTVVETPPGGGGSSSTADFSWGDEAFSWDSDELQWR